MVAEVVGGQFECEGLSIDCPCSRLPAVDTVDHRVERHVGGEQPEVDRLRLDGDGAVGKVARDGRDTDRADVGADVDQGSAALTPEQRARIQEITRSARADLRAQREGKGAQEVSEFLRGFPIRAGEVVG